MNNVCFVDTRIFFYKQQYFLGEAQCCLTNRRFQPRMFLMCCLFESYVSTLFVRSFSNYSYNKWSTALRRWWLSTRRWYHRYRENWVHLQRWGYRHWVRHYDWWRFNFFLTMYVVVCWYSVSFNDNLSFFYIYIWYVTKGSSLGVLLMFCLFFDKFQPSVVYKSVAYKKKFVYVVFINCVWPPSQLDRIDHCHCSLKYIP